MSDAASECPLCGAPNETLVYEIGGAARCWKCRREQREARLRKAGIDPGAWLRDANARIDRDLAAGKLAPRKGEPIDYSPGPPPSMPVMLWPDTSPGVEYTRRREKPPAAVVTPPPPPPPAPRTAAIPVAPEPKTEAQERDESLRTQLGRPLPEETRITLPDGPPEPDDS